MLTVTPTEVKETLSILGNKPNLIAQTLVGKGIHGYCEDTSTCVIAQFLTEQYPGYIVQVDTTDIEMYPKGAGPFDGNCITVTPTKYLGTFIERFDKGYYPSLLRHWDECDKVFTGDVDADEQLIYRCTSGCYTFYAETFGKGEQ